MVINVVVLTLNCSTHLIHKHVDYSSHTNADQWLFIEREREWKESIVSRGISSEEEGKRVTASSAHSLVERYRNIRTVSTLEHTGAPAGGSSSIVGEIGGELRPNEAEEDGQPFR